MRTQLTQKQETFCVKYFELLNGTEAAIQAGYKRKTAAVIASENLRKPKIWARIQAIRDEVKNAAVMSVQERKERLSEVARARLTDFMELGPDGSWVNIGQETPQGGAIQEIHSRTEYDEKGAKPTVHTSVKLHDPMKAIDLLNKMDGVYSESSIIQDNRGDRIVNITVVDGETKKLITQVAERTKLVTNGSRCKDDKSLQGDPEGLGGGKEKG